MKKLIAHNPFDLIRNIEVVELEEVNYYKHLSLQFSVLTIFVAAFTVAVKTVFNF